MIQINVAKYLFVIIAFTMALNVNAQKKKNKKKNKEKVIEKIELKNEIDSVSYSVGVNIFTNIQKDFSACNFDAFIEGLKDAIADTNFLIKPNETQVILQAYFQKIQEAQKAEELKAYEKIKEDGVKFLEENKNKEGVQVTESGLQYLVLKEGTGKRPTATSNVTVHYTGTTIDGTVFDSSVQRGEPLEFPLNGVIKGWTEGLQLMKEGAKYKFFIPQELAYGASPRPNGPIKPYMALVFEVELIAVNDGE